MTKIPVLFITCVLGTDAQPVHVHDQLIYRLLAEIASSLAEKSNNNNNII